MMQHQEMERLASTCETEASTSNETHKTANEQDFLLNINFDNVEDILDFGAPHVTKNTTITSPECLPELHKITKEPVMLPEIQPQNNFTTDKEDEADYATNYENKDKRRFKCGFCGKKIAWFSHWKRHVRIHIEDKQSLCSYCKKPFVRNDYMLAHFLRHHSDRIHHCWVCGKAYCDLEKFVNHCHSHDNSEYIKAAMKITDSKADLQKQVLIAENPIPVANFEEHLELTSCMINEKVDNSVEKECIAFVKNSIYLPHYKAISINNDTAKLSDAT